MACHAEMEMLVSAYLDNEVTDQERETVERHLQTCVSCQALAASFANIQTCYRDLEPQNAPRDFRQRVTQRLDERPRWILPWRLSRLVYVCSFVVLALFGGVMATLAPAWFSGAPETSIVVKAVDIYAEDILFGETTLALDDILMLDEADLTETTSGSEDFLDSIEFFDQAPSRGTDIGTNQPWVGWLDSIRVTGIRVS